MKKALGWEIAAVMKEVGVPKSQYSAGAGRLSGRPVSTSQTKGYGTTRQTLYKYPRLLITLHKYGNDESSYVNRIASRLRNKGLNVEKFNNELEVF